MCGKHYQRFKIYGDPLHPFLHARGGAGHRRADGYVRTQVDGITKYEHVRVAERALGKPLPPGAIVHHVDENPSNNAPTNLVICPDDAYHLLLHQRMRAMAACGNPSWRLCCHCSKYDDPANLHVGRNTYHRSCNTERHRQYMANRREQCPQS